MLFLTTWRDLEIVLLSELQNRNTNQMAYQWVMGWEGIKWEPGIDIYTLLYAKWGFPGGSDDKEAACDAEDLGLIPGLGRFPGGGHGHSLQYSCLDNPHGQRSLAGYSPWGCKELDTAQQLSTQGLLLTLQWTVWEKHLEKIGHTYMYD